MDKRTLFFVLALTFTLFFVNMFFEHRNSNDMRQWNEQQTAKKIEKIAQLSKEVEKRTAATDTLPVVTIYSDADAKNILANGVRSDKVILTLAWDKKLPEKVYIKDVTSEKPPVEMSIAKQPDVVDAIVAYRANSNEVARIGKLPELGRYDLQLVNTRPDSDDYPTVVLGDYADGRLEIPSEKIAILKNEIDNLNKNAKTNINSVGDALALLKTEDGYLPVGVYFNKEGGLIPLTNLPALEGVSSQPEQKAAITTNQKAPEKFYVIESPYQQLVFSNYGGALVEINLPFQSDENEKSAVKEIEFDRDMVEKHPYNARFPAHSYFLPANGNGKMVEVAEGTLGGYYPLLRRDLIEKDKNKSVRVPPRYYSLNIVSEYPETAELVYEVKSFDNEKIVFETVQGHRRITKTFSVASEAEAPYTIDLTVAIQGDSRGLWLTSGVPEVEWISGAPAPVLKYRITRNQKADVETIDLPKDVSTVTSSAIDWVCNSNGFFGFIMDPLNTTDTGYRAQYVSGTTVPSRLVEIDQEYNKFTPESMPGYMTLLPIKSSGGTMHFRVFAGPFADKVLKTVDAVYSDPKTGYNPDYIACQSFHGWFSFISEPFAKFLFVLMNFFHTITGSWALSIVLLTVALRIMLYPLNAWSTKSMVKMQQIAPEVTAIQEKYKKEPKKAQLEIMNLYREKGVNPVSGCLPLLIQMPFLIGMFDLLKSTFELRGASFIPGWIEDLTAPDVLFSWSMPLPLIGNQFHLLPILLGIVMFLQQRLMSSLPADASLWTEQQRQQRFMGNIMAVVFTVMFYNFPSGLNIYWLSSMLLGMLQQWWTAKKMEKAKPEIVQVTVPVKGKKK